MMLKIDLDGKDRRRWRYHMWRVGWLLAQARSILTANGRHDKVDFRPLSVHSTRKGYHIRIEARGLQEAEAVALQACLGSDPIREMLNLYRVRERWPVWNLLFRSKSNGRRVTSVEVERPDMLIRLKDSYEHHSGGMS